MSAAARRVTEMASSATSRPSHHSELANIEHAELSMLEDNSIPLHKVLVVQVRSYPFTNYEMDFADL